ncbi:MAG: BlaI/MecI/CopY family transcriptional regulator [Parasporobacterium sp.]|nr:BlaI/MecI/CopY family transcriptional regulator [Parasporobacterium sp.]
MDKMTDVELQIMDCVWSMDSPISPTGVLGVLNERYDRNWALQTLCTYLFRMAGKGYLKYQRKGRMALYTPIITRQDYFEYLAMDMSHFWGKGVLKGMAAALYKNNALPQEDVDELRAYLNEIEK